MISDIVLLRALIAVLAFVGFLICRHIHNKKKSPEPLVCPLKFNCHAVVHSDYSSFMGVPLEIFGMIYYLLISLSYVGLVFISSPLSLLITTIFVVLSMGAFLFSIYLTFVQLFILKEGCFWCFISAFISVVIFILTFFIYDLASILKNILV
jgi:uncharacterized membrane protein